MSSTNYAIPSWVPYDPWKTPEQLLWLKALRDGNRKVIQQELLNCQRDRWHFLRAWVLTENAHSKTSNPFEQFPDKPHLYYLTRLWEKEPRMIVPKARQLTVTWLFAALYLHDSMFLPSRFNFIQSKKEEDADEVLERIHTMYEKLPDFMKNWQPCKRTYCHMNFSRNRSRLWAIPEGSEHLRSYTPTGLFSDETAFQENVEKMVAAASPALGAKGRLTMVSSAAPSHFENICFDRQF